MVLNSIHTKLNELCEAYWAVNSRRYSQKRVVSVASAA